MKTKMLVVISVLFCFSGYSINPDALMKDVRSFKYLKSTFGAKVLRTNLLRINKDIKVEKKGVVHYGPYCRISVDEINGKPRVLNKSHRYAITRIDFKYYETIIEATNIYHLPQKLTIQCSTRIWEKTPVREFEEALDHYVSIE